MSYLTEHYDLERLSDEVTRLKKEISSQLDDFQAKVLHAIDLQKKRNDFSQALSRDACAELLKELKEKRDQ